MNKREFRVVEYNGVFIIERVDTVEDVTGMLWWKRTKSRDVWKNITTEGDYLFWHMIRYLSINNYDKEMQKFSSLKGALTMIDIICKGEIYHYA